MSQMGGRVRQGEHRGVTVGSGGIPGVHRPRTTSRRELIPLQGHCALLLRLRDGSAVRPAPVCVFRWLVRLRIVRDALRSTFPGLQRAPIFCVPLCSIGTHHEPIAMMASWCCVFAEHRSIPRLLIV